MQSQVCETVNVPLAVEHHSSLLGNGDASFSMPDPSLQGSRVYAFDSCSLLPWRQLQFTVGQNDTHVETEQLSI